MMIFQKGDIYNININNIKIDADVTLTMPFTESDLEVNVKTQEDSSLTNKFELLNKVNVVMPVIKLIEVQSNIKLDITINSTVLD